MQYQRNDMYGITQKNSVLTSTNMEVMEQLAQLTAAIGKMKEQTKNMNMSTKPKRKY